MNKPLTIILGQSGKGKSTSIRNLDPEKTVIFNIENKTLPFRQSDKFTLVYNENPFHYIDLFKRIGESKREIVVVDSFTSWCESLLRACKQIKKGFDVYNLYNDTVYEFLYELKNCGKQVFLIGHEEIIQTQEGQTVKRLKVDGKRWEGLVEKEATIVLYATTTKGEDGKVSYVFQTQTDGIHSAKSPIEMFDTIEIPNDLNYVTQKINEYYEN